MELSRGQQKAVFALIVIVLAALGYYLVVPALAHSRGHGQRGQAAASPAAARQAPASGPAPTATASAAAASGVNIYAWLPFTQQDLATAAAVAIRFGIDYDTFTYTESAADYVRKMSGLITGQLATTLRGAYQVSGVASLRTSQKQVSTGTAQIDSLRAFGPSSLTFILTAGQQLVTTRGTTNGSTQYAVTVTGSGGSWQVNDIELESAGNS